MTDATKNSFENFLGLRSFLIMGDSSMYHLLAMFYKNIQENILDPIFDPYVPEDFLVIHPTDKITLNVGKFLVGLTKTLILAYITYKIFSYTEIYFKWFVKRGGAK